MYEELNLLKKEMKPVGAVKAFTSSRSGVGKAKHGINEIMKWVEEKIPEAQKQKQLGKMNRLKMRLRGK